LAAAVVLVLFVEAGAADDLNYVCILMIELDLVQYPFGLPCKNAYFLILKAKELKQVEILLPLSVYLTRTIQID
jgi:hypothetical protein